MIKTLEIAETINRNKQSNSYDEYCKKVLSNKQILAWIIKECISEFKDIPLEDIPAYIESDPKLNASIDDDSERFLGMNTEDHSVYGAVIIFDILVGLRLPNSLETENIGLILNVEAQANNNTPYPLLSRAIYYGSRFFLFLKMKAVICLPTKKPFFKK